MYKNSTQICEMTAAESKRLKFAYLSRYNDYAKHKTINAPWFDSERGSILSLNDII
jgi:hypothetical protein